MYVCLCRGITDRDIRRAVDCGASSMRDLRQDLGICSDCGKCGVCANQVLREAIDLRDNAARKDSGVLTPLPLVC